MFFGIYPLEVDSSHRQCQLDLGNIKDTDGL